MDNDKNTNQEINSQNQRQSSGQNYSNYTPQNPVSQQQYQQPIPQYQPPAPDPSMQKLQKTTMMLSIAGMFMSVLSMIKQFFPTSTPKK